MDRAVMLRKSKENKKRDCFQACFSWEIEVKLNSFRGAWEAGTDFRVEALKVSSTVWN